MCLAIPAEVVSLTGTTATVSVEGARREVDVSLIEELTVGDYVLVHAGFALHRWDEEDYRIWKEIHDQMVEALDSQAAGFPAVGEDLAARDLPGTDLPAVGLDQSPDPSEPESPDGPGVSEG